MGPGPAHRLRRRAGPPACRGAAPTSLPCCPSGSRALSVRLPEPGKHQASPGQQPVEMHSSLSQPWAWLPGHREGSEKKWMKSLSIYLLFSKMLSRDCVTTSPITNRILCSSFASGPRDWGVLRAQRMCAHSLRVSVVATTCRPSACDWGCWRVPRGLLLLLQELERLGLH